MHKYTTHTNQIYTILILFQTNVSKKTIKHEKKERNYLETIANILHYQANELCETVSDMCPNIPLKFFKTVKKNEFVELPHRKKTNI